MQTYSSVRIPLMIVVGIWDFSHGGTRRLCYTSASTRIYRNGLSWAHFGYEVHWLRINGKNLEEFLYTRNGGILSQLKSQASFGQTKGLSQSEWKTWLPSRKRRLSVEIFWWTCWILPSSPPSAQKLLTNERGRWMPVFFGSHLDGGNRSSKRLPRLPSTQGLTCRHSPATAQLPQQYIHAFLSFQLQKI